MDRHQVVPFDVVPDVRSKTFTENLAMCTSERAYGMKYTTFKCLANELRQSILDVSGQKNEGRSRYVPNGRISPDVRLACAIRWFAGGSPYDTMTTFGISHTTFNSFWYVVAALNRHPNFVKK